MRLLVVEESLKMASLLQRGLTEEGYAVEVASNGVERSLTPRQTRCTIDDADIDHR